MTWRRGTKGALSARFAMTRVRVGDGPVWANNRHLPGDEVWLVGEWRASGERKFLPIQPAAPHDPAGPGRHDQGALGLRAGPPAAQGGTRPRPLRGPLLDRLHRHALMTCIACAYLQHLRLARPERAGRGEKGGRPPRTAAVSELAGRASGHHRPTVRGAHPARTMPALPAPLPAAI